MVYYIKKVVGIMIFYKVMLNNIIQMDKFNLKVNLKMVNPMDFVKNFFKMDNWNLMENYLKGIIINNVKYMQKMVNL